MANKNRRIVKLESEGMPRHFYTTYRPRGGMKSGTKLRLKKYNPLAMKHMWYKEVRLK